MRIGKMIFISLLIGGVIVIATIVYSSFFGSKSIVKRKSLYKFDASNMISSSSQEKLFKLKDFVGQPRSPFCSFCDNVKN